MSALANFSLDDTLGAALIGFAVSSAAFGVCTNQAITYFTRYPEDTLGYKSLVAGIWVLTAVDQALIGHVVYWYTITNYANPVALLERVVWTLIVQLVFGALIGTIVRLCFALRVWRFSQRNVFVTAFIMFLTLGELGLAIFFAVRCFQNPFFTILPKLKVTASLALGASALVDVVIATSLCYFLRQYRTGSKRADTLVSTLTVYAVNTGAFTASISILTLVFYDLRPNNLQFLAFFFILSKLYTISFYCTLNTRRIIHGKGTEGKSGRSDGHTTHHTLSLPNRSPNNLNGAAGAPMRSPGPRTTLGTTGTIVYGYGTSTTGAGESALGSRLQDVHEEASYGISEADEEGRASGSDVKARDHMEYGYPDSNKGYSNSPSNHEKDEIIELQRTGDGSQVGAYAYSPPTSPVYSHSLDGGSRTGYGWGSAVNKAKGLYVYGSGPTSDSGR